MNHVVSIGLPDAMLGSMRKHLSIEPLGEAIDTHATVLIARGEAVSATLLNRLPALKLVVAVGSGYDHIDARLLLERGIVLANSPGGTAICVADLAIGLLLDLVRRIAAADRFVRARKWESGVFGAYQRFSGRRLGIIGMGAIGLAIARRAVGFDLDVAYCNRRPRPDSTHRYFTGPAALAEWSDYLVIACPASDSTRHLVDAAVLRALGPEGFLVNISRGSVIDEAALVHALKAGEIAGAALDVFEDEPQVPDSLLTMENVVLTPHIAGRTKEGGADILQNIVMQIETFLSTGAPQTRIESKQA